MEEKYLMAYFFFSHARDDWDPFMEQFYEDLVKDLSGRGKIPAKDAGFRDQANVEPGETWPPAMSAALACCQTFVYVHSPWYFASEYCGKEWTIFRDRVRRYAKAKKLPLNGPQLMLPILWYRPTDVSVLPEAVADIQYTHKDFGEIYSREGLQHVIKRKSKYESEYYDFVEAFSTKLRDVGKIWSLSLDPTLPDIESVASAWLPESVNQSQSAPTVGPTGAVPYRLPPGPGFALFYYIAGPPSDYAGLRAEACSYGKVGGPDWSPYYPPPPEEKIALIAQKAVNDMNIVSYHFPPDDLLADRIAEAQENNNIVVIVIDPWSLRLERYSKLLKDCDGRDFYNCAVLMAWNNKDPESNREIEGLKLKIQKEVLKTKFLNQAPNYFLEPIGSRDDLASALIQAVSGAHSKISKVLPVDPAKTESAAGVSPFAQQPTI
jgi:FxsC-like protein